MLQPQMCHNFLQKTILKGQNQERSPAEGREEAAEGEQVSAKVDEVRAHVNPPELQLRLLAACGLNLEALAGALTQTNFKAMVEALERADFSSDEIQCLLELLAGLLHLSNIYFAEGEAGLLELQDTAAQEALKHAARLLGIDAEELKELLRCRRMRLKGDTVMKQRNQQQSVSTCCSLIKFIYSRLFDHIVRRLNESAAKQGQQKKQCSLMFPGSEGDSGHNTIGSEEPSSALCLERAQP